MQFPEVFATLYKNGGSDSTSTRVFDTSGTPQYMVAQGIEPMPELA